MIQKDPSLTPDTIKARLMKTATKNFPASSVACDPVTNVCYTSYYDLFTVGAGYVDVWAALNVSDTLPLSQTARSPKVTNSADILYLSSKVPALCGAPTWCGARTSYGEPMWCGAPRWFCPPASYGAQAR